MNEDTTPNNLPSGSQEGASAPMPEAAASTPSSPRPVQPESAAAPQTPTPTPTPTVAPATPAPSVPMQTSPTPPPTPPKSPFLETGKVESGEPHSFGPAIGAGIVIVVIALGGLYFWGSKISEENDDAMSAEQIRNQEDPSLTQLQAQGSSDEVSSIEQDLDATDLDSIDTELNAADQELN